MIGDGLLYTIGEGLPIFARGSATPSPRLVVSFSAGGTTGAPRPSKVGWKRAPRRGSVMASASSTEAGLEATITRWMHDTKMH